MSAAPCRPERTSWLKMPAWKPSHSWLLAPEEVESKKPVLGNRLARSWSGRAVSRVWRLLPPARRTNAMK